MQHIALRRKALRNYNSAPPPSPLTAHTCTSRNIWSHGGRTGEEIQVLRSLVGGVKRVLPASTAYMGRNKERVSDASPCIGVSDNKHNM